MVKKAAPPTKVGLAALGGKRFCQSGTVLAVDPSIGSANSMPGYALAQDGQVVDSGILRINPRDPHNRRLAAIQSQLRHLTPNPDVLVCEAIAPMLSVGGPNVIQLHWACGVIQATYPDAHTVLVPNQTWKKQIRDNNLTYVKSDEHDALMLLYTFFKLCNEEIANEDDVITELAISKL